MSYNANEKCIQLKLMNSLGVDQNGEVIGVIQVINGLNKLKNN